MKKIFILAALLLTASSNLFAQCDTANYKSPGFYPAYIPTAAEGVAYQKTVIFVLPQDTTISGFGAHIDSVAIVSVTGFPIGGNFSYACDNGTCSYKAPSNGGYYKGCITLSGTPPIGSAGKYKLSISVKAYAKVFGNPITQSTTDTTFKLNVVACNLNTSINEGPQLSLCPSGSSKTLHASPIEPLFQYSWSKDGTPNGISTDSLVVTSAGTYLISITDTLGCVSTASIVVDNTVDPLPNITQNVVAANLPNDINSNFSDCIPFQSWTSLTGGSFTSGIGQTTQYNFSASEISAGAAKIKLTYNYGSDCSCIGSVTKDLTVLTSSNGIEKTQNNQLQLFPNPVEMGKMLQLNWNGKSAQLVIYDVLGKQIRNQKINNGLQQITLENIADGTYTVVVSSHDQVVKQKLVIQK